MGGGDHGQISALDRQGGGAGACGWVGEPRLALAELDVEGRDVGLDRQLEQASPR